MDNYKALMKAAQSGDHSFFYETTVGAALPVISTIQQMQQSGDKIESIEAILSGTLNYLLSNFDGSVKFSKLVNTAKELGYTEPDPRIDLSGTDVLRKTLILSREIGFEVDSSDIKSSPLEDDEDKLLKLYRDSSSKGERLRYIASIKKGAVSIGLKSIKSDNPLFNISGTDNAVIIKSQDYPSPLKVIGAGAGSRQTATGIFNDILKIK